MREALEAAILEVGKHNKAGREWMINSVYDTITKEGTERIRALMPEPKTPA